MKSNYIQNMMVGVMLWIGTLILIMLDIFNKVESFSVFDKCFYIILLVTGGVYFFRGYFANGLEEQ